MKTDRTSKPQDVLITFHHPEERHERMAADKLSHALNCDVVTFKQGQLEHILTPPTQTRIGFHGDGNPEFFGSSTHYLSPVEFGAELIKFLHNNPNITDVDLFSCNLGLIDQNDNCYALMVQEYLDAHHYGHVTVNTFAVDNKNNAISNSFFIVGLTNDPTSKTLNDNQFSIDVLKKDNTKQVVMSQAIEQLEQELFDLQVQRHLLEAIKKLLSEHSDNITSANLQARLEVIGNYNQNQSAQILKKYGVQVVNQENDLYVTTNIFPKSKYEWPEQVQKDFNPLDIKMAEKVKALQERSKEFAELRTQEASITRVCKDEIANVRKYLTPMRHLVSDKLMDRISALKTRNQSFSGKRMGNLIKDISNTYKGRRLHADIQKLDIYARNLAEVYLAYKNNNQSEAHALKSLAIYLGNAYQNCITEGKDVDECIKELKQKINDLCFDLKTDYTDQASLSSPSVSGSAFGTFTNASLTQQLIQALENSEQVMTIHLAQTQKATV